MTRVNDYMWEVPHTPTADDPPDVVQLQQMFNLPIADQLREPMAALGYELRSSDIIVPPDSVVTRARMSSLYKANVRFTKFTQGDVMLRVHFEHDDWALDLPTSDEHRYTIDLDRFRILDRATMRIDPEWAGRRHTLVSSRPGDVLAFTGDDKIWVYESVEQLSEQLDLFLHKFESQGVTWLET